MAERLHRLHDSSSPPSDPGPASLRAVPSPDDRPTRAQLIAASAVGFVLVAAGLVLSRRSARSGEPGAEPAGSAASLAGESQPDAGPAFAAVADAGPPAPVALSDARVLGCHDRGALKTPPDRCDRVAPIEQALSRAIERSASCVPASASSATIEYVADVSFSRRRVRVTLPRTGRTVRDRRVVGACTTAVRDVMQTVSWDGVDHEHARYLISVVATYRGGT